VNVPQISKDSANDVCLKKDGALCVILVAPNKSKVDSKVLDTMHNVGQTFSSKISRGISFYFSWIDASEETAFTSTFELTGDTPQIVVLNPGKRKRFLVHEGDLSEASISNTLDKILGGDAKFKNIQGNSLPALVSEH
jgi:hypothetical protein